MGHVNIVIMKKIPMAINYNDAIEARLKNKRVIILDGKPCIDAPDIIVHDVIIQNFDPTGERQLCANSHKRGKGKIHVDVIHLQEQTLFAIADLVRLRLEYLKNKRV
jgi:hypothetical protein